MMKTIMIVMSQLFRFETQKGKQRGILSIYILHSIKKKPKTGYDLIAEIKDKTEGTWDPSKGTIYPILKHLEEDNLISVKEIGLRSKKIFMITSEGKKTLSNVKKHGRQMQENFLKFRKLISEIFGSKHGENAEFFHNIRVLSVSKSKIKNDEVINILDKCVNDLKKI